MIWVKKINIIFLAVILIAPILCVTISVINDDSNISSLIVTTVEEEQEEGNEKETELDTVTPFLSQSVTSICFVKSLDFYTKRFKQQNRSGNIFSPPPELV